jgi:uncharacterized membrane protein YecN with MAPEG domain
VRRLATIPRFYGALRCAAAHNLSDIRMNAQALPTLVVILSVVLQLWMMAAVGLARRRSGIDAPAMSGDPGLERAIRVQMNTLEQLAMFLPSLWLAWTYWGALPAGIFGLAWITGRVLYAIGYWRDAGKRGLGFMIAALATLVLLIGGSVAWLIQVF